MAEELTAQEQEQFKAMQTHEAEEKVVIEAEKAAPEAPEEPEQKVEVKEVPIAALHEERKLRKDAEEAKRQLELNQVRLDERLRLINDKITPPPAQREIPDPEKDALGALKATTEEIKAFREFQQRQTQSQEQAAYENRIKDMATAKEVEFMKKTPDYGNASEYLRQSRANELAMTPGIDPSQIGNIIRNEALQLAASALKEGKDPAELIYNFAKGRGYTKATTIQNAQPDTDLDKLARIAEGQKANMSLGNVNSTPSKPDINGKDLLSMSDEQFKVWLDKLPVKERAKYLGQ